MERMSQAQALRQTANRKASFGSHLLVHDSLAAIERRGSSSGSGSSTLWKPLWPVSQRMQSSLVLAGALDLGRFDTPRTQRWNRCIDRGAYDQPLAFEPGFPNTQLFRRQCLAIDDAIRDDFDRPDGDFQLPFLASASNPEHDSVHRTAPRWVSIDDPRAEGRAACR
jgi:hypothetical protein